MMIKELERLTGGLSNTSKLPGPSYGIPSSKCIRGGKLSKVPGTVCFICYAARNMYTFPCVQKAQERRRLAFLSIPREQWIAAMAELISRTCRTGVFRWFDSGDLQSQAMLRAIVDVCDAVPQVNFWMSTRERKIVSAVPHRRPNLVVRVSADMIDGPPPKGFAHTSTVSSVHGKVEWAELVAGSTAENHYCPAPLQGNKCGECRACWDPAIVNVTYKQH